MSFPTIAPDPFFNRIAEIAALGYAGLKAKVQSLPEAQWRTEATCILFAVGGFAPALRALSEQAEE